MEKLWSQGHNSPISCQTLGWSAGGHQPCVTLQFWVQILWHIVSCGLWELWKAFVLHRHSFLFNFVSVLSYRFIVVAAVYQPKFTLALPITIWVLKQTLTPVDLEVLTEVFYSRAFCLESNHVLYSFFTKLYSLSWFKSVFCFCALVVKGQEPWNLLGILLTLSPVSWYY